MRGTGHREAGKAVNHTGTANDNKNDQSRYSRIPSNLSIFSKPISVVHPLHKSRRRVRRHIRVIRHDGHTHTHTHNQKERGRNVAYQLSEPSCGLPVFLVTSIPLTVKKCCLVSLGLVGGTETCCNDEEGVAEEGVDVCVIDQRRYDRVCGWPFINHRC